MDTAISVVGNVVGSLVACFSAAYLVLWMCGLV
jgi:hypothetical protein